MTNEEVAVKLEGHDHEIDSLKHRMNQQEENSKQITELVLSVQRLAQTMEGMLKEQQTQGDRLATLESEPGKQWSTMKRTFFTAVTSSIGTALAIAIIKAASQYI